MSWTRDGLRVVGIVALSVVLAVGAFRIFALAQYAQQAVTAFDSPGAASAGFVGARGEEVTRSDTDVRSLRKQLDELKPITRKAALDLFNSRTGLYLAKSNFKGVITPILTRRVDDTNKIRTGLEYGDLEANYNQWLRLCPDDSVNPKACRGKDGASPEASWAGVRNAQQSTSMAELTLTEYQRQLAATQAELTGSETGFAALVGNKNDSQHAVLALWSEYTDCRLNLLNCVVNASRPFAELMPMLAVLMGALGGLALSWISLVETSSREPTWRLYLNPLTGALAGILGYFVLLFGATFLGGGVAGTASPSDAKTVVALALLLGLGGSSTLTALRSLGQYLQSKLPGARQ